MNARTRSFAVSGLLALLCAAAAMPARAANGYGMTWVKVAHTSTYGVDHVGCPDCNPYSGDTACTTYLPVLCIKTDGAPNPGLSLSFYSGWIGGNIGLTPAVAGTQLANLATANGLCSDFFGAGWQMAEFHHPGGGWNWASRGNVKDGSRFWVYINDQPGNCWN